MAAPTRDDFINAIREAHEAGDVSSANKLYAHYTTLYNDDGSPKTPVVEPAPSADLPTTAEGAPLDGMTEREPAAPQAEIDQTVDGYTGATKPYREQARTPTPSLYAKPDVKIPVESRGYTAPEPEVDGVTGATSRMYFDNLATASGKAVQNVPERFEQSIAGLVQLAGEDMAQDRARHIQITAERLGITPGDYRLLAWAGKQGLIDPKQPVPEALQYVKQNLAQTLTPAQERELAASGIIDPQNWAAFAQDWRQRAQQDEKFLDVEPGSAAYYGSAAIASTAEMGPMLVATMITRNPRIGMAMMGGQVEGQAYASGREQGLTPDQAQAYALATAAAEAIPEALPLSVVMRPGSSLIKRALGTAGAESAQETFTEALQIGIDQGYINPDMTWGEARARLADAAIIGGLAGPMMAGAVHPVQKVQEYVANSRAQAQFEAAQNDAIAREALNPDNAQMEQVARPSMADLVREAMARKSSLDPNTVKPQGMVSVGDLQAPTIGDYVPQPGAMPENFSVELPIPPRTKDDELDTGRAESQGNQPAGSERTGETAGGQRLPDSAETPVGGNEQGAGVPGQPAAEVAEPAKPGATADQGVKPKTPEPKNIPRELDKLLPVVADSWERLRKVDLQRLADTAYEAGEAAGGHGDAFQSALVQKLRYARPDLVDAAIEAIDGEQVEATNEDQNNNHPAPPTEDVAVADRLPSEEESLAIAAAEAGADKRPDLPERYTQVKQQGLTRRFANDTYRAQVESLANELTPGGDVSYVRDENDRIVGRTASINPSWFQNSEDMASVKYVQDTVQKALNGEKLGARQKRVIESLMDIYDDLNDVGDFGEYGALAPHQWFDESGALLYLPEAGREAYTIAQLEESARAAGLPEKTIQALWAKGLPLQQHAEALYEATQQERSGPRAGQDSRQEKGAGQADIGQAEAGTERPETEGLLTSYTEQELAEREARQKADAEAKAEAERKAAEKAQADKDRDDFTLTGSNRTADVAASRGQNDMFGASPKKAETKNPLLERIGASVGDTVRITSDIGYSKAGGTYKIDSASGEVFVTNVDTGSKTSWSRADLLRAGAVEVVKPVVKDHVEVLRKAAAKRMEDTLREAASHVGFTYKGNSLKPLAQDIAEHAIQHGRRLTDAEEEALAKKHGVPLDVVRDFTQKPFSYDRVLFDSEQGDKDAKAFREDRRLARQAADQGNSDAVAEQTGRQARAGGEYGLNGEWYKGGQFMPASAFTVKGEHKVNGGKAGGTKRVMVEPGQFETVPKDARPVFPAIREFVDYEMIDGKAGPVRKRPRPENFPWEMHFKNGEAQLDSLIEVYNQGTRFLGEESKTERKNYSWDATQLADAYTPEELNAWAQELRADPASKEGAGKFGDKSIYNKATEKKLDALAMAVYYHQSGQAKETLETPTPETPESIQSPADFAEDSKDLKGGPYPLAYHNHLLKGLRDGTVTLDEFNQGLDTLLEHWDEVAFRLNKYNREQLMAIAGYRWKVDHKKPQLVESALERILNLYLLDQQAPALSYSYGDKLEQVKELRRKKIIEMARSATADSLAAYAEGAKAAKIEREQANAERDRQLADPQSLEDFKTYARFKSIDSLSDAQLATFDRLRTEAEHETRTREVAERNQVQADVQAAYELVDTTHSKKGHALYVLKLTGERLERDQFNTLSAAAKKLGGYYSSFRGNGAIPGFQFTSEDARTQFQQVLDGDTVDASERAEARAEQKKAQRTTKVAELADKLEERAEQDLSRDRKDNTARRAQMAASAEADARARINEARVLRNVARAAEAGEVPILQNLSALTQLEELQSAWNRAYWDYTRALPDDQKRTNDRGISEPKEKPSVDAVVRFASMPQVTGHASGLKWLAEDMLKRPGFKAAGARIAKVAQKLREGDKDYGPLEPLFGAQWDATLDKIREYANRFKADAQFGANAILEQVREGGRLGRMGINEPHQLRQALRELRQVESGTEKTKADRTKELERSLVGKKNVGIDFFPTPPELARRVIREAHIADGMSVLEPSAGHGALAEAARAAGAEVDAVELSATLREILQEKGFNLVGQDFTEYKGKKYDRIVMNPPFSNGLDADHVRHAYSLLKPGGRLVAITGRGIHQRGDKKAVSFREWLDERGALTEELPSGSFKDSLNQTGVETNLVIIDKPGSGAEGVDAMAMQIPMPSWQPTYRSLGLPQRQATFTLNGKVITLPTQAVRREGIVVMVKNLIGPRLYDGKIRGKSTLGHYKRQGGELRTKGHDDVEVLAHELAHYLDFHHTQGGNFTRFRKRPHLKGQIEALSYTSDPKKRSHEGFAEFVRLWLTQYSEAVARAPQAVAEFEAELAKTPIAKKMHRLQEEMHKWYLQGPASMLSAKISGEQLSLSQQADQWRQRLPFELWKQQYLDRAHAAKVMTRTTEGGLGDASVDPYKQLQLLNGIEGIANESYHKGAPAFNSEGAIEYVGPSLEEVWRKSMKEGPERIRQQEAYFVARRAAELKGQDRENLLSNAEIQAGLDLEQQFPYFANVFRLYQQYRLNMMDFYVDSGYLSREAATHMQNANQNYVPFQRVVDPQGKGQGRGASFNRLKGGTQNLKPVFETMLEQDGKHIQKALKARALRALYEQTQHSQDGGLFLSRIAPDSKKVRVTVDELAMTVAREMAAQGIGISKNGQILATGNEMVDIDDIATNLSSNPEALNFWTFGHAPKTTETMVTSYIDRNGKQVWLEINEDNRILADMLDNMDHAGIPEGALGTAIQTAMFAKRYMTLMITSMPQFVLPNIARDQQQAFALSGGKYKPVWDALLGMGELMKGAAAGIDTRLNLNVVSRDTLYHEMKGQGGPTGGRIRAQFEDTTEHNNLPDHLRKPLYHPTRLLNALVDAYIAVIDSPEVATRMGLYRRLRKEGVGAREAAWQARQISTDFAKHGTNASFTLFSRTIPFFNAYLQSVERDLSALAENNGEMKWSNLWKTESGRAHLGDLKVRIWMASSLMIALPILLALMNADDEEYQSLTADQKTRFYWYKLDGEWYTLPKPHGSMALAGAFGEAIVDKLSGQDDISKFIQFALVYHTAAEAIPGVLTPIIDLQTNTNFTGAPVVPRQLEGLTGDDEIYQYDDRTPQFYIDAGRKLGVSPIKLQHLVRGYLGYVEAAASEVTENTLWNEEQWGERPFPKGWAYQLGKQFVPPEVPYRTKWTESYYDLKARATSAKTTLGLLVKEAIRDQGKVKTYTDDELRKTLIGIDEVFRKVDAAFKDEQTAIAAWKYNKNLTRAEKEAKINDWRKQKNAVFADVYHQLDAKLKEIEQKLTKD